MRFEFEQWTRRADRRIVRRMRPEMRDLYVGTVLLFEDGARRVDLRERPRPEWSDWFTALGLPAEFGIVTASNPAGRTISQRRNCERANRLYDELLRVARSVVPVFGCSPDLEHREASYAAGLPEPIVAELAARFEQDAYFWWDGARFWLVAMDGAERIQLPS